MQYYATPLIALVLILLLAVSACGQRGDLYLPPSQQMQQQYAAE